MKNHVLIWIILISSFANAAQDLQESQNNSQAILAEAVPTRTVKIQRKARIDTGNVLFAGTGMLVGALCVQLIYLIKSKYAQEPSNYWQKVIARKHAGLVYPKLLVPNEYFIATVNTRNITGIEKDKMNFLRFIVDDIVRDDQFYPMWVRIVHDTQTIRYNAWNNLPPSSKEAKFSALALSFNSATMQNDEKTWNKFSSQLDKIINEVDSKKVSE